jgi:flagellar basal-body rod protein FlgB
MIDRLDQMLNFHQQALRISEQRQQVLASNIANADTPNYKARDLDFKAALSSALGPAAASGNGSGNGSSQVALETTEPGHIAGSAGSASAPALQYRTQAQGSVDGNTVNMDTERAAFAENAVYYEFNLDRISQQIKSMLAVIQG